MLGHMLMTLIGWTLKGAIQSHIDVYVSQATLGEVNRSFPYMVSKEFASGGGDVDYFSLQECLAADIVLFAGS